MEVARINKTGTRVVNKRKTSFLSLKLILNLNFVIIKNVIKKNGTRIRACFKEKVKG